MNAREKAHRELTHVLAALEDGLHVLVERRRANGVAANGLATKLGRGVIARDQRAAWAFRNAVAAVVTAGIRFSDAGWNPALRKLAPVLLDIYLDAQGVEVDPDRV